MRKTILVVATFAAMSACSGPTNYYRMPWAKVSIDQASTQCRYEIQANPFIGWRACMDQKGWRAVD
jgi:hypothetical protein